MFRLNPYWPKLLEQLRKDRIRKSGGKLVFHGEGEVEIDAHGVTRAIPNSDEIVDTDIFHGSVQRMRIQVVLPELVKKRISTNQQEAMLNGELACLIQFGYETAVPAIQRMGRRWIVRLRRYYILRELTWLSMHVAAVYLQSWVRKLQTTRRFAETLDEQHRAMKVFNLVVIQKNIRRFVQYKKYRRIADVNYREKIHRTVSVFQAIIRGFIVRRRNKKRLAVMKDLRVSEEADWAAAQIQKIARGFIVKKTILKSLTTRKVISKDLLHLAERYLDHGDLWGFLKELDDTFLRMKVS